MNRSETLCFRRPEFREDGRVVARKPVVLNGRTFEPGVEITGEARAGLTPRDIRVLWDLAYVDTLAPLPPKVPKTSKAK